MSQVQSLPVQASPVQSSPLLARIHRRFSTVSEVVRFGHIEFSFTRAADPDRVLDEVAAEADRRDREGGVRHAEPLHLPYWAQLWDSAAGIAQILVDRYGPNLESKNVLDLGCGQGLTGCAAAALGANVLFADLEPPALLFARLNAQPISRQFRTRRVDWQKDDLHERFDLIIGADILYERAQWVFLDPFWQKHLGDNGKILLGEPGRPTGNSFGQWITDRGWKSQLFQQGVKTQEKPIRIFELSRLA